jgi:hypothetical protein
MLHHMLYYTILMIIFWLEGVGEVGKNEKMGF